MWLPLVLVFIIDTASTYILIHVIVNAFESDAGTALIYNLDIECSILIEIWEHKKSDILCSYNTTHYSC